MRKLFLLLIIFVMGLPSFAAKIPQDVKKILDMNFNSKEEIRFDGLITLPDSTIYLPLYPARIKKPEVIEIKQTFPADKKLGDLPEIVIFNNDFVLMKIIKDKEGNKTFFSPEPLPIEVKTGLLPQDLLVPKGLLVPESMKTIIGALKISTKDDMGIRVKSEMTAHLNPVIVKTSTKNLVKEVKELKDKIMYIATCYSKNIQVVEGENASPKYALAQKSIPIDMKITPDNKYLLVTVYNSNFVDVISLKDEEVIKRIELQSQGEEIIVDKYENMAYVSSPLSSCIYVIDLKSMMLKQKIVLNGMCERLYLTDDSTKLFYYDKASSNVWVIDIFNDYAINEIGKFPNVSKFVFAQNKLYMLSRSKDKIAIVDYATKGLLQEFSVPETPVDLKLYNNDLFILGGKSNTIMVLDTKEDVVTSEIYLNPNGFATSIYQLPNTHLAIVTDTKIGKYYVLDMDKKKIVKTNQLLVPVSKVVVIEKNYGPSNN